MSEEFEEVTRQQAEHFGVLASKLRMDSTLIGSNIASCTRLALVIAPETESATAPETETIITAKAGKDIKATGYQSPFDTEATYRKKNETTVKGYSVNVTETCHEDGLNLITDTIVKPSTASDTDFFQDGIEQSERVTQSPVSQISTDGAYHSPDNQKYAEQKGIEF